MATDAEIRARLIRNSTGVIEPGPRPDAVRDGRDIDPSLPYMPGFPTLDGLSDTEQLVNAHSGAFETAKRIRQAADRAWLDEPRVNGFVLTPAQRVAWKREHVKAVVEAEMEKASKLLKPITERGRKELAQRQAALVAKGTPKLDGVPAQKAMMIADRFSKLDPETRSLRIIDAMNSTDQPASRELLEAVAWCGENLDLVAPETLARVRGTLVAVADAPEYDALTKADRALQATEESISNLEAWAQTLPNDY